MKRTHPARRPDDRQRAEVRAELHTIVDRAVDDWPAIEGYADWALTVNVDGGRASPGSHGDPTGHAMVVRLSDPAHRWLGAFVRWRADGRALHAEAAKMAPAKRAEAAKAGVEVCALCGLPVPKLRRVDGQAYCPTSCFYRVWRTKNLNLR